MIVLFISIPQVGDAKRPHTVQNPNKQHISKTHASNGNDTSNVLELDHAEVKSYSPWHEVHFCEDTS